LRDEFFSTELPCEFVMAPFTIKLLHLHQILRLYKKNNNKITDCSANGYHFSFRKDIFVLNAEQFLFQ
jgi:hypothetical protein